MGSRAHPKDENTFFLFSCEMPCLLLSIRVAGSLLSPLPHLNFSTEPNTEKHREPNLSSRSLYRIYPKAPSQPPRVWVKACSFNTPQLTPGSSTRTPSLGMRTRTHHPGHFTTNLTQI